MRRSAVGDISDLEIMGPSVERILKKLAEGTTEEATLRQLHYRMSELIIGVDNGKGRRTLRVSEDDLVKKHN